MSILALIPARGGSKGIPRKNLRRIGGRSLVEWSIFHAQRAASVDRVIVSTDSDEIREIALRAGAEVPFIRPAPLSEDSVLDHPVFLHALTWLQENEGAIPDIVVHLRPTAPYRRDGWIDTAIAALVSNPHADAVRSVSEVTQHPYRVFETDRDGMLIPIMRDRHPAPALLRRQDLPTMYYYNCVIDVTRASTIIGKQSMTGERLVPWIMPADEVVDIDTPRDLDYAEWFMGKNTQP